MCARTIVIFLNKMNKFYWSFVDTAVDGPSLLLYNTRKPITCSDLRDTLMLHKNKTKNTIQVRDNIVG